VGHRAAADTGWATNRIVYDLYSLTEEEIRMVEEGTGRLGG